MQAHGSHRRWPLARQGPDLVGTQMIAKGLDFPNVTLVGVINADTALHLPDFRAAERTFHLVTQVAGRTGRGPKGGRVLVQTFSPDHPAIQAAVRHDYAAFAAGELPMRQMLRYPPFAAMIRLVVAAPWSRWRGVCQYVAERRAASGPNGRRAGAETRVRPRSMPVCQVEGRIVSRSRCRADAGQLGSAIRQATADWSRRKRAVDRGRGSGRDAENEGSQEVRIRK
jgi:primosomal protein N' (replication factor Y)